MTMKTNNNYQLYSSGGTDIEVEELAPPMTINEAAKATERFIDSLSKDIFDIDLGSGL